MAEEKRLEDLSTRVAPGVIKIKKANVPLAQKIREEKHRENVEYMYAQIPGITGEDFEDMFFGDERIWRKFYESKGLNSKDYQDPKECVRFIEKNYPKDREVKPVTKVASDLYNFVADRLGIDSDEEVRKKRLRFFDARQAPIDYFIGVDGFFEFINERGEKIFCTLDLTQNPEKQSHKADLLFRGFPDYRKKDQEKDYKIWIEEKAKKISGVMQHKSPWYI